MNIFESEKYTPLMFISIILVTLLILFSSLNLFEDKNYKSNTKGVTGFAISEINNTNALKQPKTEELYSEKAYFIYYLVLVIMVLIILILSSRYFLPWIKENS